MKLKIGSTLLVGLLLSACGGGIAVQQDFIPGTDFSGLRTWDWMPTPTRATGDRRIDNEFMAGRIRTAIEEGLAAKGFQRVTSGEPNFRVGYQITVSDETDYQTINDYWGPGWGYGGMYGPGMRGPMMTTSRTTAQRYSVGTLVLDFFSTASRELVWRGSAEGKLNQTATPDERQKRASAAVNMILDQFPPKR